MAPNERDPPDGLDVPYAASVDITRMCDEARDIISANTDEHLGQLRRKIEADVTSMMKSHGARIQELEHESKNMRECIATLRVELTNTEKKEAMAVADARKARAELEDLRDSVQAGQEPLRAELELWKESTRKYRKKLEHSEQAHARLKARAGAAGFVEATPPQLPASEERPHGAKRVRPEETRRFTPAAPSPAPETTDADPSPSDVDPTFAPVCMPADAGPGLMPDPGVRWRRKGGPGGPVVAALAKEASLRRANSGDSQLWGATQVRGGDVRGGDAYAAEDRKIFKLGVTAQGADRRPANGAVNIGGDENNRPWGAPPVKKPPAVDASEKIVKFVEVVRKKSEREKLPAFTCEECDKFYAAAGLTRPKDEGACQHRPNGATFDDWSRHRARWAPPPAPAGYWNLGFGTQQSTERTGT